MNYISHDLSRFKANPKSADIKGKSLEEDDIRNIFQRDRDRIMYGKAFRRLAGKTQVLVTGHDDHLRTRLTHTLEVSQIARTISSKLGLDLDLTEAIALGHDIGHAPFGHVGERVLNYFLNGCELYKGVNYRHGTDFNNNNPEDVLRIKFRGFKHNWQAVRIVIDLARHRGKNGFDLSSQTIYGILHHTKLEYKKCDQQYGDFCKLRERGKGRECKDTKLYLEFYEDRYGLFLRNEYFTLESLVVSLADEIAQRHHDIEDGLRSKIIEYDELIEQLEMTIKLPSQYLPGSDIKKNPEDRITILSGGIVSFYVKRTINSLRDLISILHHKDLTDLVKHCDIKNEIIPEYNIEKIVMGDDEMHEFLKNRITRSHMTQIMDGRADFVLRRLFKAYLSNPQQLPDNTIKILLKNYNEYYNNTFKKPKFNTDIEANSYGELRNLLTYSHNHGQHVYKGILLRTISDYLSGMTDKRAMNEYRRLYGITDDMSGI